MKLIACTAVLLISLSLVFAEFIPAQEAEQIASQFFIYRGYPNARQTGVEGYRAEPGTELPEFYIVRFQPQGFMLIAAEEQSQPILAYSFDNIFPEGVPPDHVKWFLDTYSRFIRRIRENPQWANDPAWAELRGGNFSAYMPTRDVAPLCSTTWNQDWPYNSMCPADAAGPGGHVYAGCVATAMGQVMKKWNHPVTGNGSSSYYATGYGTQSVNYGATTYNWAGMPNAIASVNTPIATLLYHCGVAVEMDYAADGSGANYFDARNALVNYFRYNSAALWCQAASYPISTWETMLRGDLDLGRPILYAGEGTGGHAFVMDGYEGTNHFHFNWGWSGWYNGNFYLSNLNPGDDSNFTQNQEAILHIYPVGGVANDLAAVSVSGNSSILVNQPATYNVTISNAGTAMQTSYTVKLMRSTGITLASVAGTAINPGATLTFPLTWTPTATGTFNLYARVELASDTNAANNESPTLPVTVGTEIGGEGFENFSNFAIAFAPWTVVDVDQSTTYTISGVNWLNAGTAQAYIIFVPSATTPPITSFVPHGGLKSAACFASTAPPNNDWLITPIMNNPGQISFWAKSFTAQYGLERFKVGVSTTGTLPSNFTIISGTNYIQAPVDWTQYTYDLSSYSGNVYVGIQCVSNDAFIFFVDDVLTSGSTQVVATPTFNPAAGTYATAQNVAISCATPEATIRYTTNGNEPTETSTAYTTPINVPLGTTMTIKAKGYKTGWTPSPTAAATYIVSGTVATPTFNPPAGTYTTAQNVAISCATPEAVIRFTTNGTEPTEASPAYTAPIAIPLETTLTLKAKGFKTGWTPSPTATASYFITGTVATPAFNPVAGTYTTSQLVMLSCATQDAVIRYTTDATDPTEASPVYSTPITISLNTTMTIKARGYKTGWAPSPTASATYIVTGTVATPSFNPPAGSYNSVQNVAISCTTAGAQIRYTLDGTDPVETSALYSVPLVLNSSTTLKARAYKPDWTASAINTAVYQIVVATQDDLEVPAATGIAGIYPNPFRGSTTLKLGIKDTAQPYAVQIFNIKGECVYELAGVGKGYIELVWDGRDSNKHSVSSGVYLLRFTSGNHQSVKKMLLQ